MESRDFYLQRLRLPQTCQRTDDELRRLYEQAANPCQGCRVIRTKCGGGPPPSVNGELAAFMGSSPRR